MMDWARERNLCRMIVINRIDAENVNLPALLAQVQESFGSRVPAAEPAGPMAAARASSIASPRITDRPISCRWPTFTGG